MTPRAFNVDDRQTSTRSRTAHFGGGRRGTDTHADCRCADGSRIRVYRGRLCEEALRILCRQAESLDALFTDIDMPGTMDGLELARRARRKLPRWRRDRVRRTETPVGRVATQEPVPAQTLSCQRHFGSFPGADHAHVARRRGPLGSSGTCARSWQSNTTRSCFLFALLSSGLGGDGLDLFFRLLNLHLPFPGFFGKALSSLPRVAAYADAGQVVQFG